MSCGMDHTRPPTAAEAEQDAWVAEWAPRGHCAGTMRSCPGGCPCAECGC